MICCTNFLMMFVQFMVPFPLAIMPVQSEHVCDWGNRNTGTEGLRLWKGIVVAVPFSFNKLARATGRRLM